MELGIVSLGCNSVKLLQPVVSVTNEKILSDYKKCFDKIRKFI